MVSRIVKGLVLVTACGLAVVLPVLALSRGDWAGAAGTVFLAGMAIWGFLGRGVVPQAEPTAKTPGRPGRDALLTSPDPVVAVDRRAVVTAANDAAFAMLPGLRVGVPLAFTLRAPEVLEALRSTISTGEPGEIEYGGRTGAEAFLAVRLRPLQGGPDPRSPAVALFFSDRTKERRVEAMRVDFIATVSHELRTPLASLTGFIETLAGPARDDPRARDRFLGIMRDQAERMRRLVDDLLQLSRVELHEHVAPTAPVELGGLVMHMIEIMGPLAKDRKVTITLDRAPEPLTVPGDRDELLRVVENLIANAMKYGGEGTVEVSLRPADQGRAVELAITDHGPGIPPEHLPRLTERFYRVNEAESRARGGTGLGLAIVKHVVGRHRGRLTIESELGRGTTVRILFPAIAGRRPVL
ncbi:sensor histidine kinase [Enterovirga rhinocerotis]|uniref:histidine kinase n=1 Tax=Enterovirga rhinocerotis TaxID=1339210 RepID=A0A4R7BHZ1_9HYPH|nr:ATP-binding protein [Enterovirga rhinocerotis]TDR84543.1 two-component system phosphate regulon sensor histidine kinase PhoR [Enterovirga rhinocerotis]